MAIRSSVVIYSIDTQALQTTGITAADSFRGNIRQITAQMNNTVRSRSRYLFDNRAGADLIARQTGGFQVKNSNDYKFDRILEDQSGYYLIGYKPSDETFNRRFHKITAKVKRSGMSLRTRYGFFGYSEEDDVRMPESKILLALMSPFGAQDVQLDFNSFFANNKVAGSFVRSFVFVNAKELTFETVNGKHEAKIEVRGMMFGGVNLTDDQKAKMKQIGDSFRERTQSLHQQLRAKRQELRQASEGGTFNEALATQKLQESASLEAKLMGEQFRMRQEMLAVLTPEQKTQLEQKRAEFKAKRANHGERKVQ